MATESGGVTPPQPSPDRRMVAALERLKGRAADDLAKELQVGPDEVERWAATFVEGGRQALEGRLDPTSSEARDRFLILIAHELRTPLTIIGGWVETMLGSELSPEQQGKALEVVHKQVAHLERIARDALDSGAVAQGHLRLVIAPLKLRALVAAVVSSLRDNRFELVDGAEIEVVGDGSRLEQITAGVLEQARRIGGEGPLEVVLNEGRADQVMVEVTAQGRELSFAEAAALFEPYGRPDTSVGTGLGLYLCRALLVAHGGELGIRSRHTTTTLWFRLPRQGPAVSSLVERL